MPRHISPNVLSHPPSMRTPIHARHLATMDVPYDGRTPLPFSNYSVSLKRDILSSSGQKKKTIELLSRGSLRKTTMLDRSDIIANAYSPLSSRNARLSSNSVAKQDKI